MLDLVELQGFGEHHPWQLSGGMQQRVSIARALSFDPALLLMDEPFGALDEMTRERLNAELLRIWQASESTVVFVTHSIAEAVFLSTRVVVMSARPGRISKLIPIDLPQPRTAATREDPRFFELATEVREALHMGGGARLPLASDRALGGCGMIACSATRDWLPRDWLRRSSCRRGIGDLGGLRQGRCTCSASSCPRRARSGRAFAGNQGQLWHEGWFTFQEALGGFAIGCAAGILFAVVVARWNLLGSALMPYAIAANAIPIIAFAPITNAWFDPLTKTSKMVIAAVLCFFPVFVNVVRGLRSVKPEQIELMRSYAVGELTVFRLVRVPTALPFLFTALRVASVLAMIGAIVSEYYGGSLDALGANIEQDASLFQFERRGRRSSSPRCSGSGSTSRSWRSSASRHAGSRGWR